MKHHLFSMLLCLVSFTGMAQSPIMVCNASGNTCAPYYNLDSAYSAAVSGDYIYIPGGVFTLAQSINKEVHIIGAGSSADSAQVTGMTTINGNINLATSASNSSLEGLYITGSVLGSSSYTLQNITLNYLNFNSWQGSMSNSNMHGCILRTSALGENNFFNGTYNNFSNCYIRDITGLASSNVTNCIGMLNVNNNVLVTFKNNIFSTYPSSQYGQAGANNQLLYNVYITACSYACISLITSIGNVQTTIANTFQANALTYSNMKLNATATAMTAGENGSQAGVYGGLFPYKAGAVPSNPHIYQKNISASTNTNGQLPVQISVRAEDY